MPCYFFLLSFRFSSRSEACKKIDGGTRVIYLTDDGTECSEPAATSDSLDLTQVSVDTSLLKNIFETVNKNETASAASACPDLNLLSFHKPKKKQK